MTHRAHRPWTLRSRGWVGTLLALAAQLALAQGLPDEAAAALNRGQRLAAEALLTYPQHFPDQPLWAEALAAGREAAAAAPEHPAPQRFLAQAYGTVHWYARAWTHWQAYLELGGTLDAQASRLLLTTATWLGYHAYDQGWGDQARPYLETAVRLDPGNLGAHERLARLALDRGAPEDALVHLQALGDAVPDLAPLRDRAERQARHGAAATEAFEAGEAAAATGAWTAAFDYHTVAVAASSDFVDAWRGLAAAAAALGRPGDAASAWDRVLAFEPGDATAVAGLQLAREQLAFGVEAQRAYQRGLGAYRAGDVAAARIQFQSAVAQNPSYVDAIAWLGRIAAETGDLATAATRYRSARALAPGRADIAQALAQVEARIAAAEAAAAAAAAVAAPPPAPAPEPIPAPVPAPAPPAPAPDPVPAPLPEPPVTTPEPEPPAPAPAPPQPEPAPEPPPAPEPQPEPAPAPEPTSQAAAAASWLVVIDTVVEHRAASEGGAGAFTFLDARHLDRDLGAFAGGTLHVRLDVRSKPTDEPVRYQLCVVPEDIGVVPACTDPELLEVTTVGSVAVQQSLDGLTSGAALDWAEGIEQLLLVLRRPDGEPIDDRWSPGQADSRRIDAARFFPMAVRVSAILVAPGGTFPGWR